MMLFKTFTTDEKFSLEDIRFFLICLFTFSLPFDRLYSQLIIVILLVLVFIDFDIKKLKFIPKKVWVFQSFFFLTVIGLLNTSTADISDGSFIVEKQLAIFILPILMPLSFNITQHRVNIILQTLLVSSLISILYLIFTSIFTFYSLHIPFSEFIQSNTYFNHSFSAPLNIHAGYLSMYISLSAFYILKKLSVTNGTDRYKLYVQIVILIVGLLLLASRTNTIILFIVALILYPLFRIKSLKESLIPVVLILGLSFLPFYFSSYLKNRYGGELIGDISSQGNVIEPRIVRWKECISLFKESPVIGHGTGSEIHKLQEKYWEKGLIYSYYHKYNAHNQYLSILIKHGILGFIAFVGALVFFFRIAIRNKSFLYLAFLIQISVLFFTENVLDVNKGIFYFAFFNTLFGFFYLKQDSDEASHINNNPRL